ncbi:DUF1450 domain-containing protein [Alicyclobacillus curvatus]|nr:DUF1450 domain-containing protein [Alicyclobacillus curvatus]
MYGGFILIEVCDANPASRPELFRLEEEFVGISIIENTCMSECELCAQCSYVFFDGDIMVADTPDSLLSLLRQRMHQLTPAETDTST